MLNQIFRLFMLHRLMKIQDKKHEPDYLHRTTPEEQKEDQLTENAILYFLSQDGNKPTT